jgi:hypothetical protein
MKYFFNLEDFWEYVQGQIFTRKGADAYQVQVLQNYRVAAAFAFSILKIIKDMDKNIQECIANVIAECESVLADKSIFLAAGKRNPKLSKRLYEAVEKADNAVAHAGNILNNIVPLLPVSGEILSVALRARDICDSITRRKRIKLLT